MIDILGKRSGDPDSRGRIDFVDLAGSEALGAAKSKHQEDEGLHIKSSLTALKTFLERASVGQKGDARSKKISQYIQGVLSRSNAKLLVIATVSSESHAFSQTKEALEFIASISKLKKMQENSPSFLAVSREIAARDRALSAKDKPWGRGKKAQEEQEHAGFDENSKYFFIAC
jgi:hypothetical protein